MGCWRHMEYAPGCDITMAPKQKQKMQKKKQSESGSMAIISIKIHIFAVLCIMILLSDRGHGGYGTDLKYLSHLPSKVLKTLR